VPADFIKNIMFEHMIGAWIGEIRGVVQTQGQEVLSKASLDSGPWLVSRELVLSVALAHTMAAQHDFPLLASLWEQRLQEGTCRVPKEIIPEGTSLPPYGQKIEDAALYTYLTGYASLRLDDVLEQAGRLALLTHEHPANQQVAQAVAAGVYLGNNRFSKRYFKAYFEDQYKWDLAMPYAELSAEELQQDDPMHLVYRSLLAFLQSADFDDAIRISLAIGDAAHKVPFITSAMAEAFYQPVPDFWASMLLHRLPPVWQEVIGTFEEKFGIKATEKLYVKTA
jgi:hypothetical protein